jgi:hypothetical protein
MNSVHRFLAGSALLIFQLCAAVALSQIPDGATLDVPNVRISSASSMDPEEVSIAVNPLNPQNLAAGANIYYYYYSTNGGLNWTQGNLSSTYGVWGDPCLIFDGRGYLYYGHLSNPSSPGYWIDRIVVNRSTNGGVSWNAGAGIGFHPPVRNQDKEWLAADMTASPYRDNLYVTWTEFDNYSSANPADSSRILFSRSTDAGLTWSTPLRVSDHGGDCVDEDNTVEGAVPAIGPNGEIYTAWSGPLGIMFDRSTDGGMSWGEDVFVTSQPGGWDFGVPGIYRCNGMPVTACDVSSSPYRGRVYVLWGDQRNGVGDTDVFLIASTDGGVTWGPTRRVNNDLTATQQFFPWMTVDQSTGYIYAVFYDRRNTVGNTTEVWIARSTDGGETFSNYRVSQSSFNPTPGIFFGDYTGITALNGKVYPIWMRLDGTVLSVWAALVTDSTVNRQYTVAHGWNIISLPVRPSDPRASVLFPTAESEAYEYDAATGGYVTRDSLHPGKAYWLRFGPAQTVGVSGLPIAAETVDVVEGWNLIGSVDGSLAAAAVQEIPPGIIESAWYAFGDSGYSPASHIEAAQGYWVKVSAPGSLVLRLGDRDIPSEGLPRPRFIQELRKTH